MNEVAFIIFVVILGLISLELLRLLKVLLNSLEKDVEAEVKNESSTDKD